MEGFTTCHVVCWCHISLQDSWLCRGGSLDVSSKSVTPMTIYQFFAFSITVPVSVYVLGHHLWPPWFTTATQEQSARETLDTKQCCMLLFRLNHDLWQGPCQDGSCPSTSRYMHANVNLAVKVHVPACKRLRTKHYVPITKSPQCNSCNFDPKNKGSTSP